MTNSTAAPVRSIWKARRMAALAVAAAASMFTAAPAAAVPLTSERCQTEMSGAESTAAHHFFTHIKYAHVETSPIGQAQEAVDADDYAKLHAIWVESMVMPFIEASSYC